jgi:hypothetical protein
MIGLPEPAKAVDPTEKIEDPSRVRPTFDSLVTALASPDFAVRQRATEQLAANDQFTLEMMESTLARKDLTLECRYRLSSIARQRFFRTPRAALGFRFGEQLRDPAVVGETFQPFPAAKILEPGDMIIRADGVKLDGPAARPLLQSIIISHDPGEILHVVIRRGARKMELEIPLGKFADLGNGGGPLVEERLARAWRFRVQSRMGGVAEPIRIDTGGAPWVAAGDDAQRKMDMAMRREANEQPIRFAGGGMPRTAVAIDENRMFDQVMRPQLVVVNGQVRVMNMPMFRNGMANFGLNELDPDAGLMAMKPEEELARLLELKQDCQRRLGNSDPESLPAGDARRLDLIETRNKLAVINKQMDAIQAERDDAAAAAGKSRPPAPNTVDANAPHGP